jgi:ferredoxin
MQIQVDRDVCELHAQCVSVAPELFHIDDDGVLLYAVEVPDDWRQKADQAAALCPTAAITVHPS